jgi:glycosyltransferase involved in cell wall biosynthesis
VRLLILTQYFPPEVGAPQNRLFELARELTKLGVEVEVLTAMPNYPQMEIYSGYHERKFMQEDMGGIKVHRSSIFVSKKKSIVSRLRNYFSFVISSMRAGKKIPSQFDFLLCESPPLFLGYSALYLARLKKARLIFNVSDLWPESAEKLGVVTNRFFLNMAYRLEARLYRRSVLVTGQTQGICKSIQTRFPEVKTYWLPNGVDLTFYDPSKIESGDWRKKNGFSDSDFILLYAGILGLAQGLEVIIQSASELRHFPELKFVLIGSGPEKDKLIRLAAEAGTNNVYFMDAVAKSGMPEVLRSVDAAIIPLKKLDLFLGAIPSKIFENLSMEVPVLLGVDGEARELFVNQGKCALYFEPGNAESLSEAIVSLRKNTELKRSLAINGRIYVQQNFNRPAIAAAFYNRLKQL